MLGFFGIFVLKGFRGLVGVGLSLVVCVVWVYGELGYNFDE